MKNIQKNKKLSIITLVLLLTLTIFVTNIGSIKAETLTTNAFLSVNPNPVGVNQEADIAVAKSAGHTHPVFCLMKKTVWPSLSTYLAQGERRVSTWQKSLPYIEVKFNDCNDAFTNLNTLEELKVLDLKLTNA